MNIKNIFFQLKIEKVLSERAGLANQNQFIVDQDTRNRYNSESDWETLSQLLKETASLNSQQA